MSELHLLNNQKLNISLYNNTDENIEARTITYFDAPVLNDMSEYNASITKLRIPASILPIYKGNTEDLKFGLHGFNYFTNTPVNVEESIVSPSEGFMSLDLLKRELNHTLLRAFYNYCLATYSNQNNAEVQMEFQDATFNQPFFQTVLFIAGSNFENPSDPNRLIGGVKMMVKIENTNNQPLDKALEAFLEYNENRNVYKVRLLSNIYSSTRSSLTFHLSDDQFNSTQSGDISQSETHMRPVESFLGLHGLNIRQDANHSVKLIIGVKDSNASFNYKISSTIKIASIDKTIDAYSHDANYPIYPPTLSTNEQTGIVSLNFQKSYQFYNIGISFSNKLNTMLGFETYKKDGLYYLRYEPFTFEYKDNFEQDITNSITYRQKNNTLERWHNISKIEISSTSLNTQEELNNDQTSSDVITSFSPVFSESPSLFEFDDSSSIVGWRNYRLQSSGSLDKLDLSVYIRRTDGSREMHRLAPDEYLTVSILLVKAR